MTEDKSEYIKNWLFRANEDIAVIESLSGLDLEYYTSTICFHAQQAVEKYLKAYLIYHDIDFPRTHDVDYLLLECQKIDKDSFEIDLLSLTDYGVSIRYPDDFFIPGIDETKVYLELARQIKQLIEEKISL